ncbi:MAG TPA: bifunctional UDP-3-O-[3-hydroxymyristoyl] N-acetylglucosamine deacetylase/3-hydroxyacyl-ACP dehydratase [Candidatus Hydrogenedentes bacterium]|nr:bifunctional UDP-3-O-[3-hydroxymyristoyl] N-acetylglucosamine deacetylase/3-hydroxyacyl-ACP dehydratase [Candidatus Hydrogenedentota bacterium]
MVKQRTLAEPVSYSGIGLHTGNLTEVTFRPAPPDTGIVFVRKDLPGRPEIPASVDYVVDVSRGTTIGINGTRVHTIEHAMSALCGLGIDNAIVEVDADEIPNGDGSAMQAVNAILRAGTVEQDRDRRFLEVEQPVHYQKDGTTISILPAREFRVSMTISYDHPLIGTQFASFVITEDTYRNQIAPARTFCFLREVKMLQEAGLIRGGSLESAVVIGDDGVLNEALRFEDEFVRHKILDLIGDTFLLGRFIRGHIIGVRCGHEKNVGFSRQVKRYCLDVQAKKPMRDYVVTPRHRQAFALDVNKIMRILPHRYPFLLVDRVVAFEPMKSAVGIKNVTVNEPFFQGHWPDLPVMPGVLILEALAQVSAVLVFGENGEPNGRLAFFTGVEKAKFRHTVVPGDQLVLEVEMLHCRSNACKVRGVAKVDDVVAAEAVMYFALMHVDE